MPLVLMFCSVNCSCTTHAPLGQQGYPAATVADFSTAAYTIWGQLQSVPITGWMDEDDEQVTSAVLVAGDEPVKAVKDGKLTKFQKDFESCWWHSGANIVDGSPFISRDDVVKFYVEARGIGLKSARQYAKSSNSSAMVGYLVSVEVIAVSGNGWVMMDNVSKSLMLLRKNEPGNEGNRS